MARRRNAARLLVAAAIASVAFAIAPAPAAPEMYCPPDNPACIPIIVACRAMQSAHGKVTKLPECNLMLTG
ncbi:MAG: hypothetical protein WAT66_00070 [Actinomycetota bacterium]